MSDDKIKSVAIFLSGNSNVLCEIGARNEVIQLNSLWIEKIINMYIEVSMTMNSCGMIAAVKRKDENWFKKVEKG